MLAGTLGVNFRTFVTISRRIILRKRTVSDKISRTNQNKICGQYINKNK